MISDWLTNVLACSSFNFGKILSDRQRVSLRTLGEYRSCFIVIKYTRTKKKRRVNIIIHYYIHFWYKMSSLWNHLVKIQLIFNLTDFHYSRPSNKIYVAHLMHPALLFRPSILIYVFTSQLYCNFQTRRIFTFMTSLYLCHDVDVFSAAKHGGKGSFGTPRPILRLIRKSDRDVPNDKG